MEHNATGGTNHATGRVDGHRHLPGLTGLRAIAVGAVVAYHLEYLDGGFIGVDLFFVLSGFLITSLLLNDTPSGTSGMLRWWGKRVRRLTPAVAVMVLAVLGLFFTRSDIAIDALATMTWWQNWHLIEQGAAYWAGSPSPLRHAWSLSIEEQFYLIWPPVLVGLLALGRRLRTPSNVVAVFAALGTVASFGWAALLATRPDPTLSRLYFGTDTRAGALLLGCAAAAWMHVRPQERHGKVASHLVVPAFALLVAGSIVMSPDRRWIYTGGLAVVAVAALTLVAACTRDTWFSRLLSWAPLQWLGDRSYALYLWSWPIQVYVEQRWQEMPQWGVAAVTVAVSLPLSDISRRLVEEPLRRQSSWAVRLAPRRAAWALGTVALLATGLGAANSTQLTVQEEVALEFERLPDPVAAPTTTCAPPSTTTTTLPGFTGGTDVYDPSTVTDTPDPTGGDDACGTTQRLLIVGDSTGRGAANGLRRIGASGLEVWDRTELGCGMVADNDDCPDWRTTWAEAVEQIDPDIVLVYLGPSIDLVEGDDPDFLSDIARLQRQTTITEAVSLLRSRGARVVWAVPALPLEAGRFYCKGKVEDSPCDEDWLDRWNEDLLVVTARTKIQLLDVGGWVEARGNGSIDRPDGLHLSGPALLDQARWIEDELA